MNQIQRKVKKGLTQPIHMGIKTSSLKYYHTHFYSLLNNLPQVQFQTNLMNRFRDKLKNNDRGPIEWAQLRHNKTFSPKKNPVIFCRGLSCRSGDPKWVEAPYVIISYHNQPRILFFFTLITSPNPTPSIETHLAVVRGLPTKKFLPECVNEKSSTERRS